MQPLSINSELMRVVAGWHPTQAAVVKSLLADLETRAGRIDELEGLLGLRVRVLPRIKMRPIGRLIFGILLNAKGWTSTESLIAAIWGALPECDQPDFPYQGVKVHVCYLRSDLKPHGVTFDTVHAGTGSGGYFMPPAMKALAQGLIIQEGKAS